MCYSCVSTCVMSVGVCVWECMDACLSGRLERETEERRRMSKEGEVRYYLLVKKAERELWLEGKPIYGK